MKIIQGAENEIILNMLFGFCPKSWQNFVNATVPNGINSDPEGNKTCEELLNVKLKKYSAVFCAVRRSEYSEKCWVEFQTDENYLQFLLEWG